MNGGSAAQSRTSRGFNLSVGSRNEEIDRVCDAARDVLTATGLSSRYFDVDLLLREFMTNAIVHGNGSKPDTCVEVTLKVGPKWIVVRITDQGPGFSWRTRIRTIPGENETSGRGLAIGALYAHRVRYNNAGNQVTFWLSKTKGKEIQEL